MPDLSARPASNHGARGTHRGTNSQAHPTMSLSSGLRLEQSNLSSPSPHLGYGHAGSNDIYGQHQSLQHGFRAPGMLPTYAPAMHNPMPYTAPQYYQDPWAQSFQTGLSSFHQLSPYGQPDVQNPLQSHQQTHGGPFPTSHHMPTPQSLIFHQVPPNLLPYSAYPISGVPAIRRPGHLHHVPQQRGPGPSIFPEQPTRRIPQAQQNHPPIPHELRHHSHRPQNDPASQATQSSCVAAATGPGLCRDPKQFYPKSKGKEKQKRAMY